MQKLIELEKDEAILVSSQVESFLKPDFVYLPVLGDDQIKVYQNSKVDIGSQLFVRSSTLCSVSGIVRQIKKMDSWDDASYYLEVENDFEERRKEMNFNHSPLTKEIIFQALGIEHKDEIKNIVLNAIDDEVYVLTENFYLFLYYEEFLALLDEIRQLCLIDHIYVCLKASSSENVSKLMSELGMYPEIELKIVPDLYLLGKPKFLLSYLGIEENNTYVISAKEFYRVYHLLKRNRIPTDELITISGDGVKNPKVVQVKIGARLKDVVDELIDVKDDVCYIANGLMSGREIHLDSFVITSSLDSLLIMKNTLEKEEGKCINCGLCSDICPVLLYPKRLSEANYRKQCINCGLCSYICPVHIKFRRDNDGKNSLSSFQER